jgi:hypothetical protein
LFFDGQYRITNSKLENHLIFSGQELQKLENHWCVEWVLITCIPIQWLVSALIMFDLVIFVFHLTFPCKLPDNDVPWFRSHPWLRSPPLGGASTGCIRLSITRLRWRLPIPAMASSPRKGQLALGLPSGDVQGYHRGTFFASEASCAAAGFRFLPAHLLQCKYVFFDFYLFGDCVVNLLS